MPLLLDRRVDFVVIDTAHGDTRAVEEAVREIKRSSQVPVVAGNVATREGTRRLIEAGADAVKVGVGPGSICTTRVVAGIGVAQFSAVMECAEEAEKSGVPVIADGGIRFSGDITKAIAAGASTVMVGNLFAGLKEAPGREVILDGRMFKEYRGMGSMGAIQDGGGDRYQIAPDETPVPEGIEGLVPYTGELHPFLYQLVSGLRKGMGYCGCRTVDDLRRYRRFVRITPAGLRESHPHDVRITQEAPNYSAAVLTGPYMDTIYVLDFGGQTSHLIARRVRDLGVYSEVLPGTVPLSAVDMTEVRGLILSGSPASVYEPGSPRPDPAFYRAGLPVLGICYGLQVMTADHGGEVVLKERKEFGRSRVSLLERLPLFEGVPDGFVSWMSHGDTVEKARRGVPRGRPVGERPPAAAVAGDGLLTGASNSILK